MFRTLAPVFAALLLTSPLSAACLGQDLRSSLTEEQQAALDEMRADRPFQTGNHWLAEKDGERLHLIGTIHLDDEGLDAPAERLSPLIQNAAAVLLEMTAAEQSELKQRLAADSSLIILTDTSLPELMPEEDWQRIAEAASARGVPGFMMAKFRPWYASTILGLPACINLAEAETLKGMDARIETIADASGVPTRALETFDAAIGVFANMPMDMQIGMLKSSIIPSGLSEDVYATLVAAYLDEAHVESWLSVMALTSHLGTGDPERDAALLENFEEQLLYERNRNWIPVIEQTLSDTEGPVIAAFGAAHLGGEEGVLNLLKQNGYTLTRQPF